MGLRLLAQLGDKPARQSGTGLSPDQRPEESRLARSSASQQVDLPVEYRRMPGQWKGRKTNIKFAVEKRRSAITLLVAGQWLHGSALTKTNGTACKKRKDA